MKISTVVKNNLCVSCGLCAGVCPKKCITSSFNSVSYLPTIDENSCINCGLCYKVCPGKSSDYTNTPSKNILAQSASGGVITTLIKNLLRDKIYDVAFLVDTYNHDKEIFTNLYTAESDFTNTPKSRYLTVNHSRAISYMIKNPGKKIIFVGTSCFIQGILNVIEQYELNRENYFLAGLFCDKTMNYNVWNYFKSFGADKLNFKTKECNGWSGEVGIERQGKKFFLPRKMRMQMKEFFCLERCLYCLDKLNQFADISFGDNYTQTPLPENMNRKEGTSCVILRTKLGVEIFSKYRDDFLIANLPPNEIYNSQHVGERMKNFIFSEYKSAEVGYPINKVPSEISCGIYETPEYRQKYESLLAKQKMGREKFFPYVASDIWGTIIPQLQQLKSPSQNLPLQD